MAQRRRRGGPGASPRAGDGGSRRQQGGRERGGGSGAIAAAIPSRRRPQGVRAVPKHIIIAGAALLALILIVVGVNWWFAVKRPADTPILEVNSRVFRWSDYIRLLRFQKLAAAHLGGTFQAGSEPYSLMQIMTENELISQASAREGLRVTDAELRDEMTVRLVPNHQQITDPAQRDRELTLHLGAYLDAVQLTRAQYEDIVRADLLRRQLRDKLGAAIPQVQPQAYIQLIVAPTDRSEAVQQQLKDGVPFETVARRFSEEQNVETNGGEVGWVPKSVYQELDRPLFGWREGETQHIIEAPDGWWVVRIVEKLDNAARMEGIRLATEDEADGILRRIRAGENFTDLAAQFSTEAVTRDRRGDMGIVAVGERGKDFDEAIRGVEPGTLIGPSPTHEYVYFAVVKERSAAQEVSSNYFEVLKQRALEDWLNKERVANYINYCPGGPENCFGSVKVDRALREISSLSLTRAQEATATAAVRPQGGQPAFAP